ncbi:DUF3391 domain-containing protein [Shewanella sp. C32]|uniref:DUF3391 domain-containing protein n=1 Tax=Shewanella electrica TaxID=515560 RepID=A0ABT2FJQ8_9GAMM|nr:HD domain-containing phosphohydrolase [Shewanella electrica]MCH1924983.1 DUF3391 domain-containing protein [Shewanella electrica]MCS4556572.1 DUF3391 domain-containing protein [Shewanella electrica]
MAKSKYQRLSVNRLQIGLKVKLPLSWTEHPFLFNKIAITSAAQIEMIKNLGVPYVELVSGAELLQDSEPEAELIVNEVELPSPQQAAVRQVRKALRQSQNQFIDAMNQSRTLMSKLVSDPEGAVREAALLVEMMLDQLYANEQPRLALVSSGENRSSITQHGISVATLALVMGHHLELDKPQLRTIATGAVLHDVGKLRVPEDIRTKRKGLTGAEKNFLAMHPNFGYDLLKKSGMFSDEVLNIVLHHHEFYDGSGYPDGLKGDKISLAIQLVSLANDFDSQLWRDDISSPQIALGHLFKNRAGMHQQTLIQTLVKVLGIYPPGTIVQLSDGLIAKVMLTTSETTKPQVWSCTVEGNDAQYRFLMDENVVVEAAIKPSDLSRGASKTLQADSGISFYIC